MSADYSQGFANGIAAGQSDAAAAWRPHVDALQQQLAAVNAELQRVTNARDLLIAKSNALTRALAFVPAEARFMLIEAIKRELATTYVNQLVEVGCAQEIAREWAAYEASVFDTLYPQKEMAASPLTPPPSASSENSFNL